MLVYVILLLLPLVFQHAVIGSKNIDYEKKNKRALTLFFLVLTLLIMLRHESVGNDTSNYLHFFRSFSKMDWVKISKTPLEIGFSYFLKTISLISEEPQFFLAVSGLITVLMIYPTYRRLCIDPSLTILIFVTISTFVMMFSGIRQMLAVGIGFIAYEFTRRKKLLPFILIVILAMTFHTSAFMLAFMYPLYHARITKKWLLAVVPCLAVVFVFNAQIFSVLALLIERYTAYDGSVSSTGAYAMLFVFAAFTVFAFLIPDESKMDTETIGLRNFLLLALVVQMFAPLHTLAMRMNYYYIIFIPLLLPKIIENKSERWKQIAVVSRHIMILFLCLYFFISARDGGGLHIFPYRFFWEAV